LEFLPHPHPGRWERGCRKINYGEEGREEGGREEKEKEEDHAAELEKTIGPTIGMQFMAKNPAI
jgi:hypothetical protein